MEDFGERHLKRIQIGGTMERNIPDVRDIFGRGDSAPKPKQQELRTYDYSPRSRRRHEAMDSYDHRLPPSDNTTRPVTKERKPRHRTTTDDLEPRNKTTSDSKKDAAYYNNRTLTERDIRHLERHLSMKKTIRKQISRNLAQAFVDDPDLAMTEPPPKSTKAQPDKSFTLTRAKVSKSEQNVLDLLKDNEPDSGHCSADNPNSSDDDSHHQEHARRVKDKASHGNSRSVQKQPDVGYKDDGKFSFWKMFSVKNRKR